MGRNEMDHIILDELKSAGLELVWWTTDVVDGEVVIDFLSKGVKIGQLKMLHSEALRCTEEEVRPEIKAVIAGLVEEED